MSLTVKPRALTWWHWIFYEQKASLALWIVTFMIPINIKEMSYERLWRLWRTCKWMSEEALTTAAFSCFKLSTKCLVWCQVSCSTDMSTIFPTSFNNKHWVKPWWECGEGRISETIAIIPDWCLTVSRRLLVWAVIMWWPGVRGWRRVSQREVSVSSGTRDPRHHHHCMTKQAPASFSLFQPAPACSSLLQHCYVQSWC